MESLVASIREHGILQPLLVRPLESGNYELIAGERRYRAAQTFGMEQVPVIIRHLNDQDAFQVALLENLQREDLNPVEETEAILQLLSIRLQCSQGEVISLLNHIANRQKQKTETTNNVVRNQWEMVEKIFSVRVTPRANASKLYLLTTEVKNQRKISISRLIYFHRFKAIA
ncbi:parB, chromosome partitioning protein, ParB family [Nostoc flagelliforme CCNUN1]|uniref:ParB, chromosome partitioning protein, ParB family n=2 Tax=Nostoc flagelliforme TaxID=1306274 RepID=A0A2K8T2A4_9NOSO|nr:parB, chromosome partitioning protein, ParB family [Nostoc flagelliforme CCNUN1]